MMYPSNGQGLRRSPLPWGGGTEVNAIYGVAEPVLPPRIGKVRFAKDQLPPVNAFWSVTMYDGKSQLLIENPINRYLINSPMLSGMKKNPDGSLTLYIQKESPGKAKEANWLPALNGPVYLVMRLYWPKETPPSILPPGDGTWKPPAIVAAT